MTAPAVQNPFHELFDAYENDVVGFVREQLCIEPEEYQIKALLAYQRGERRITIRSGHGVGKTAVLSWIIVHALVCKLPCKIVCTAPTSKQLFDALASEVKMWLKKLPPELVPLFDITRDRIELIASPEEVFVSFTTSSIERPEALAGVHSDRGWVILIGDEASGIPDPIFEAGSGSMSGHNAMTILAGNPVRTSGLFFDSHNKLKDLWTALHISCLHSKRVTQDYIEDMKRRYGEDSNAYRVRVLGEFPLADEDTVIPYGMAEASMKRDVKAINVRPIWGLDVGKKDRAALAKRKGNVLTEKVQKWRGLDTMQLTGRIVAEWNLTAHDERPTEINVDAIGLGAGVADRLRELGLPARAINVSELPAMTETYLNLRAELWFAGRKWFESRDCNLAEDEDLMAELVRVTFETRESSGKIQIQSKKEMKRLGYSSPDLADAFLLTFASQAVSAALGSETQSIAWNKPLKRKIPGIV